jgi:hypothetical protein
MISVAAAIAVGMASCGTIEGLVSPSRFTARYLDVWNRSAGYLVVRITVPDAEPIVTPLLVPGGEFNAEMASLFGTIQPTQITFEFFAYRRANPATSALTDVAVEASPYASAKTTLIAGQDYGNRADIDTITLDDTIWVDVLEVQPQQASIHFDTGGLPQMQRGTNAGDPPTVTQPENITMVGRVVDHLGQALPGVEVRLHDLAESVVTDANGQFAFDRPEGSYAIDAVVPDATVTPTGRRFANRRGDQLPIRFIATPLGQEK